MPEFTELRKDDACGWQLRVKIYKQKYLYHQASIRNHSLESVVFL